MSGFVEGIDRSQRWASKHRHHHLHSDTQFDVHSPRHKGFLYSHIGWIFARRHDATDLTKIADFARYPELMWLHRYERVPAFALAVICLLVAGWPGLRSRLTGLFRSCPPPDPHSGPTRRSLTRERFKFARFA